MASKKKTIEEPVKTEGKEVDDVSQQLFFNRTHTKTTLIVRLDFFHMKDDLVDSSLINNLHVLGKHVANLLQTESVSLFDHAIDTASKYKEVKHLPCLAKSGFMIDQSEYDEREFQILYGSMMAEQSEQVKH